MAKSSQKPARATRTAIIKGEGSMPVYGGGAMRRVPKGEPVELSAQERAYLKRAKIALA